MLTLQSSEITRSLRKQNNNLMWKLTILPTSRHNYLLSSLTTWSNFQTGLNSTGNDFRYVNLNYFRVCNRIPDCRYLEKGVGYVTQCIPLLPVCRFISRSPVMMVRLCNIVIFCQQMGHVNGKLESRFFKT